MPEVKPEFNLKLTDRTPSETTIVRLRQCLKSLGRRWGFRVGEVVPSNDAARALMNAPMPEQNIPTSPSQKLDGKSITC